MIEARDADVHAGGVGVVLGAGRRVLQVVAVAVAVHPGALDERQGLLVAVVAAEALPAGMAAVGGTVMATEQVVDLLTNLRDRILVQALAIEDPQPPQAGEPR